MEPNKIASVRTADPTARPGLAGSAVRTSGLAVGDVAGIITWAVKRTAGDQVVTRDDHVLPAELAR
jgi:hypothetical protein